MELQELDDEDVYGVILEGVVFGKRNRHVSDNTINRFSGDLESILDFIGKRRS